MKKLLHILTGWGKAMGLLQTSAAEAKLSALRQSICAGCPAAKLSKLIEILNGEVTEAAHLVCTECHCPALQKTIVIDETCPLKKW